jgi:excisionase family DNA binding protein
MTPPPDDYKYTVQQAAEYIGVVDKTIRRYLRRGILDAIQIKGPNGLEYRLSETSLNRLAALLDRAIQQSIESTPGLDPTEQMLNRLLFEVETVQSTQRLVMGYLSEGEELHQTLESLREEVAALREEQGQWQETLANLRTAVEDLSANLQSLRQPSPEIQELNEQISLLARTVTASQQPPLRRPWWRLWEGRGKRGN